MTSEAGQPFFSVVMPTRDRPELFRQALDSVLSQTFTGFEVLVINDGSSDQFLPAYQALEQEYDERVNFHYQPRRPNGHGQSYSMNTGAYLGRGQYVCFLDDDDTWSDPEYLGRVHSVIMSTESPPDVLYSNQTGFDCQGHKIDREMWIADLARKVSSDMAVADNAFRVTPTFLLGANGFAHLNCTMIRRDLYLSIKGMDENIRYECDRDFFLRVIDTADLMIYLPQHIARHNVPDPSKKDNMSTLVSDLEKRLYQVTVLEKAVLMSQRDPVRREAIAALANTYKHMTTTLVSQGRLTLAARHAKQALALRYSFKWQLYCAYLTLRGKF